MRAVLRRRRTVSRAVPLAATTPAPHAHPHAVGRRRAVRVIVIAMIASLWTSIIRWVVSQKSRLPLALVGIGIRIL